MRTGQCAFPGQHILEGIRTLPEGQVLLEAGEQPDTTELARTVPVWRDNELRFHIVMRADLGIGMLGADPAMQALAFACIAHEAAHVEHEGHLYRTFPDIYGKAIPRGDRSRQTFLKAMDVWIEYAACRSSAMFHREAVEEFEGVFCRALEDSLSACKQRVVAYRTDDKGLSHLHEHSADLRGCLRLCWVSPRSSGWTRAQHTTARATCHRIIGNRPEIADLVHSLRRTLHELWLSEYGWTSIEVFSPIYEIICAMMALHGFVFAKTETEWRIVLCEEGHAESAARSALASWLKQDN